MITSVLRQALRTRGGEPAVLCHTGAHDVTRGRLTRLRLRSADRVVDLDTHPMGEPIGVPGVGGEGEATSAGLTAVVAASLTDLRRSLTTATHLPRTAHLVVSVAHIPGHLGPLVPSPPGTDEWHGLQDLRVRRMGTHGWICELFFPNGVDTAAALSGVWHGTGGRRRGPSPVPLGGLHGAGGALWRSGDISAAGISASGPVPLRRVTPLVDLVVRTHGAEPLPAWEDPDVPFVDVGPATSDSGDGPATAEVPDGPVRVREADPVEGVAPIDERVVNPSGFSKAADGPFGELSLHDDHVLVRDGDKVLATIPADGTVTDLDLDRTRHLCGIRVDWAGHSGQVAAVRAVASLAAGGVPLVSGPVPDRAAGLGPELAGQLTAVDESALGDVLTREEHSVRLRRAALRTHGQLSRWRSLAARAGLPARPEPLVSVVLCTRRPELVGFALAQIARQRLVRFEVVLALHGFSADLPEAGPAVSEFAATGVPITVYEAPADQVFGSVLNDAVDRASGAVIAKWDDDDWYGPEHLADLMLARTYSGADVVGVSQNLVYLQELDLTVSRWFKSEIVAAGVVGSTILTDRSVLEDVGGFRPLPRAIDSQLLFAVLRGGGRVYRTHGLGYFLRRAGEGHTWEEDLGYFLRNRTEQWSGWRPNALLEGEPAPLGAPATDTEYMGGLR